MPSFALPTFMCLTLPQRCPGRKAYRLGKFLGNVNSLRKTPLITPYALLEWVANSGECVYYFVEQLQW